MRRKTVAFLVLMVLMSGAYCVTSVQLPAVAPSGMSAFGFLEAVLGNVVALGDPVPGGCGGGGND
ncbi:MAG: hypothetical protein JSV27_06635 [Candidatus Bathyarchaeota archaeon]|nr:MAG: hypothetical protein JSV27_06635 [Candidatus Bathyarchaeota archaeon]